MLRAPCAAVLGVAVVLSVTRPARAGETTLAEPVLEENISDIDGRESPTIEFDLTPGMLHAQHSSAGIWKNGLEAEWRPYNRLGIGAELDTVGALDELRPTGAVRFIPRGALSYVVARDFERQLFLQAEIGGRYDGASPLAFVNPTEFALPYWFGFRGATKLGPIDLRGAVFGEAGGASAHAPVKWSWAALYTIVGERMRGALGAELIADWARTAPFLVAPEGQLVTRVFGKPLRLSVAFPVTVGAKGGDASYGIAFRFVLEPEE